ncbi:hypothetical protein [Amycolatopsis sp. SID8362]|uniref:hypothetical protein n=1 Tax=Amycolatopsis sp. SID8362 TaxID=2690346 RepID=UPI001EF3A4B4|nr:hypothetical protein [Amycolatopsis sp. SID8362]
MSSSSSRSTANSPLTMLQKQFEQDRVVATFDEALSSWSSESPALADITCHQDLVAVLATRDYPRHDEVLHALLTRAAEPGGVVAAEIVVNAMLPAVPGIVGRVVHAVRVAAGGVGVRRGVTGGGVSAAEDSRDIQASVIGHLWEQSRCYPLRRRNRVAANLVRETQRAAQRDFGVGCRGRGEHGRRRGPPTSGGGPGGDGRVGGVAGVAVVGGGGGAAGRAFRDDPDHAVLR